MHGDSNTVLLMSALELSAHNEVQDVVPMSSSGDELMGCPGRRQVPCHTGVRSKRLVCYVH